MQVVYSAIHLYAFSVFLLALVSIGVALRMHLSSRHSRVGMIGAALPAAVMLAAFYMLAVHVHHSLGGWPRTIGEYGFSPALVAHAHITVVYFEALIIFTMLAWPVSYVVCLMVPRWRMFLYYQGIYAFACMACIGLMLLAPSSFLNWWWD